MGPNSSVTHYWDHQKVIKAVEKCSLQGTFGPDVISTKDLLPKKVNVSPGFTIKEGHNDGISPVKEHALSKINPFISIKNGVNARLLRKHAEKKRKDDHITPNGIPETTKTRGNIPSEVFANGGSIPGLLTYESSTTAIVQNNMLGQVPAEVWDQKVSYRLRAFLFGIPADGLLLLLGRRAPPMDRHADNVPQYPRLVLLKSQASKPRPCLELEKSVLHRVC